MLFSLIPPLKFLLGDSDQFSPYALHLQTFSRFSSLRAVLVTALPIPYWSASGYVPKATQRAEKALSVELGEPRIAISVPGGRLPQARASGRRASTEGPSRTFTGIKLGAVARFRFGLWRAECVTKNACSVRGGATGDRGLRDPMAPVFYSARQFLPGNRENWESQIFLLTPRSQKSIF